VGGAHTLLYRASGGRIGTRIWGLSILLLTTRGRKTGRPRTTPLCFLRDGDDLVVVASNGGMDWFPSWWLNLMREPRATIQVGRTRRPVRAREATPEERDRLWTQLTSIAPGYLKYQARTSRTIPLAILQFAGNPSATRDAHRVSRRGSAATRGVEPSGDTGSCSFAPAHANGAYPGNAANAENLNMQDVRIPHSLETSSEQVSCWIRTSDGASASV